MSEVTIPNSPVHSDAILTAVYGETGSSWARYHTGTDFAPYGSTPSNPTLYSVCNGTVYSKTYDGTLGNQIIIQDSLTGNYWRYCHMQNASPLNVGDIVTTSTAVGTMGATGNVTGIHLHLEYATSPIWNYDTFLNPSDALGIPNTRGTIVKWSSTPTGTWISGNFTLNQAEMENNADIIIDYYRNLGINDKTIAAILGNMQAESTINPELQETGGQGYGLVQWTPVSVLQNHCNTLGLSPYNSGDIQIQVLIAEIINISGVGEWYTSSGFISNYYNSGATSDMIGITGQQFLNNTMNWDSDKLAVLFMAGYERPSYDPNINHYQLRQQYALSWYNYIINQPIPPSTTKRKKFPWAILTNKIRNKRTFF